MKITKIPQSINIQHILSDNNQEIDGQYEEEDQ